jgi:hypothetical protein
LNSEPRPNAKAALAAIEETLQTCEHIWITGETAREVVKEAVEK